MELDFSKQEKIVGTFIICMTVLLLATVIVIGRGKNWFKHYVTYYTIFEQSYTLEVNTPVKLFNTEIGKIKKITVSGDKVKVKLAILQDFRSRIRTSTRATVQSATFIGSEYVAIIPGEDDAPLIPPGEIIPSKKRKSVAAYLQELEVEKTAKMVVTALQDITEMIQILRDPQGPFFTSLDKANQTLGHIEKISREVEAGKGTVGGILKSGELLDKIHGNLDEIKNIVSAKAPAAIDQLQDNLATLNEIEKEMLANMPNIKRIVKDVEDTVASLKTIIAQIEKRSHDIPKTIQSTSQGIQEIRGTVENIDKVVQSLQQNFLIRPHLPPVPEGKNVDAGLRP